MFQFENWPYELSADLRIVKRRVSHDEIPYVVYSVAIGAFTQVSHEDVERLKAEGVQEVLSVDIK